jgi:sugar lactone lactonase YvrE
VSGQGWLENLVFDPHRGLFVSGLTAGKILHVSPSGSTRVLIDDVHTPGGLRIRRGFLYFNTGDDASSGVGNVADGTIDRYRFSTNRRTTWARGLTMPNGLIFLPSGDAAVSRDSPGWGITRIPFADPAHPQRNWVTTNDSNGMAVDPTGTWLYFDQTFQPGGLVLRARISDPSDVRQVASLGQGLDLDDLTIDREGILYIAANRPAPFGQLIRLDPATGRSCVIADGLGFPSAVKFGCGPGWPRDHLFVVGFQGDVYDVSAPAGVAAPQGRCDAQR